ncbi:hypothetical protein HYE42_03925 [Mycoplasmopsis bovis]|nr:hypothetical protein [Mycoplasmopsis bovis]QQH20504.1 hypothetical protein HYE42_03925 [Mycoplasmopsis bovis]
MVQPTTHSQIDESKIAEIKRQRTQAWKAHKDRVEAEQNRVKNLCNKKLKKADKPADDKDPKSPG